MIKILKGRILDCLFIINDILQVLNSLKMQKKGLKIRNYCVFKYNSWMFICYFYFIIFFLITEYPSKKITKSWLKKIIKQYRISKKKKSVKKMGYISSSLFQEGIFWCMLAKTLIYLAKIYQLNQKNLRKEV